MPRFADEVWVIDGRSLLSPAQAVERRLLERLGGDAAHLSHFRSNDLRRACARGVR